MDSSAELRMDLEELRKLLLEASRCRVRGILASAISDTEHLLGQEIQAHLASGDGGPGQSLPSSGKDLSVHNNSSSLPTKKLSTYAWDQSEKFLKLYVTLSNVHASATVSVNIEVSERAFTLSVRNLDGMNYVLPVTGLLHPVDKDGSTYKVKKDVVVVMLKKLSVGTHWDCVTMEENKLKEKQKSKFSDMEKSEDPNASLMNMMKQLYEEGDDEMKRTMKKAWYEAEQKKNQKLEDSPMDF